MKQHKTKAFTLVELIIVITILAILSTIGFMSLSSYTADARDTNRITSLKTFSDGLNIYQTRNSTYPMPDDYVTITASGTDISYQGYAGASMLSTIKASDTKDPIDNSYYTYLVNVNKNKFQIMGYLENNLAYNQVDGINQTYATDYTNRIIYTIGDKLGMLVSTGTNAPVQDLKSASFTGVDLFTQVFTLTAYKFAGDGNNIPRSCNDWLKTYPDLKGKDGLYKINVSGAITQVYCDMTWDNGGRTRINDKLATFSAYTGNITYSGGFTASGDIISGNNLPNQGLCGNPSTGGYNFKIFNLKYTGYKELREDLERTTTVLQCTKFIKSDLSESISRGSNDKGLISYYLKNGIWTKFVSPSGSSAWQCTRGSTSDILGYWAISGSNTIQSYNLLYWKQIQPTDNMTDKSLFYYGSSCSSSSDNGIYKVQAYFR